MKNVFKKLLVLLVAALMIVSNGVAMHAVESTDQGSMTVNGLDTTGETVTFYQIAKVTYDGENTKLAEDWDYANADVKADVLALLANIKAGTPENNDYETFINKYAALIKAGTFSSTGMDANKSLTDTDKDGTVVWAKSSATATDGPAAGLYIAIVTDVKGSKIYNPALLSVLYDGSSLEEAVVNLTNAYANSATLKSSNPGGDKAIKDGVVYDATEKAHKEDEDREWETKPADAEEKSGVKTVGLGDKVDYEAYVDIPEYPVNAKNKTLWFQDTMCEGLTFDSSFFKLSLVTDVKTQAGKVEATLANTADPTVKDITVTKGTDTLVIGHIKFTEGDGGKFQAWMEYENLRTFADPAAVSTYHIRLDYSAIVNEKAEIGHTGNKNELKYAWSNEPLKGGTHEKFDEPTDNAEGIKKDHDEEIVYTYEISVLKVDEKVTDLFKADGSIKTEAELRAEYNIPATQKVFLEGAEFDVFKDGVKVGHIKTNANGVATLSVVSAGTYTLYETAAPAGYAFDATVAYPVTANWTTCTYSNSSSEEVVRYTSVKAEAADGANAAQVGWIKDGKYYEMDAFTAEVAAAYNAEQEAAESDSRILPAYIKSVTAKSTSSTTTITNTNTSTQGVAVIQVNNGTTPVLPSTGGVGTYVFTIAGVAILAFAAFMLIFRKRESE